MGTLDIAGSRFGKWLAQYPADRRTSDGRLYWVCRCDCGVERPVSRRRLIKGLSRSCGCAKTERVKAHPTRQPEYLPRAWRWGRMPPEMAVAAAIKEYRGGAQARGYPWGLTDADAERLLTQDCRYCSAPPGRLFRYSSAVATLGGIDRVDNTLGYTPDNCVPCCSTCNRAKNAMPLEAWNTWRAAIAAVVNSAT